MLRVTSRPRFYSWDQFDAATTEAGDPTTEVVAVSCNINDNARKLTRKRSSCNSLTSYYTTNTNPKSFPDEEEERNEDQGEGNLDIQFDLDDPSEYMSCHSFSLGRTFSRSSSMVNMKVAFDSMGEDKDYKPPKQQLQQQPPRRYQQSYLIKKEIYPFPSLVNESTTLQYNDNSVDGDLTSLSHPLKTMTTTMTNLNTSTNVSGQKRHVNGTCITNGSCFNSATSIQKSVSFSSLIQIHSSNNTNEVGRYIHNDTERSAPNNMPMIDLNEDLQINFLLYLDLRDLQNMEMTCHYFHSFLSPKSGPIGVRNCVWWNVMDHLFPFLSLNGNMNCLINNKNHRVDAAFYGDLEKKSSSSTLQSLDTMSSSTTTSVSSLSFSSTSTSSCDGDNCQALHLSPSNVKFVCNSQSHNLPQSFHDGRGGTSSNHKSSTRSLGEDDIINYAAILSQSASIPPPSSFGIRTDDKTNAVDSDADNNLSLSTSSTDTSILYNEYQMLLHNNKGFHAVKINVIQYTGLTGIGDRSIRSNYPFPRPHHKGLESEMNDYHVNGKDSLSLFQRLRSCSRHSVRFQLHEQVLYYRRRQQQFQPFVSPYVAKIDSNLECNDDHHYQNHNSSNHLNPIRVDIDLTPRLIAYFEVSILPRDKSQEPRIIQTPRNPTHAHPCVAIGLSRNGFCHESRMPGWDSFSYGYHGDDGGIFHCHGNMIRVYGPTYNVGDTVGCGVNYQNGGIFFTLNGNFLGYAWMNEKNVLDGKVDLYPTIGVDTNSPLNCNFGLHPFVFNLSEFIKTKGTISTSILE